MENLIEDLDLLVESYNYDLDEKFIATRPISGRHNSKLLVYNLEKNEIVHTYFKHLSTHLEPHQLLVLNHSKVFPCRLLGEKKSGGKAELFLLSLLGGRRGYPAMIRSNGKKRIGDQYYFGDLRATIEALGENGDFYVSFNKTHMELIEFLGKDAHIPIPPYIRNGIADESDREDYQTVYAKELGSVAAPTAGLHFTEDVFDSLEKKGIKKAFVTLHVGAGTFKTVTTEHVKKHRMHHEVYDIDSLNLKKINEAKEIIAVGTTSLRVLESCYGPQEISLPKGSAPFETDIFLYPGKDVRSVKGLITNFHLPKSTLLMLVSSILGRQKALELYEVAKENDYRFFSYGDAMLILR